MFMHPPHHAMPPQMRAMAWHLMCVDALLWSTRNSSRTVVVHYSSYWALLPTGCLEVLSFQGPEVTVQHKARSSQPHAALVQEASSRVGPFVSLS